MIQSPCTTAEPNAVALVRPADRRRSKRRLRALTTEQKAAVVRERHNLLRRVATRMYRTRLGRRFGDFDDLYNESVLHLIDAAERFNPVRGDFDTYARKCVWGSLKQTVWDRQGLIRVPLSALLRLFRKRLAGVGDLGRDQDAAVGLGVDTFSVRDDGQQWEPPAPETVEKESMIRVALDALARIAPDDRFFIERVFGLGEAPATSYPQLGRMFGHSDSWAAERTDVALGQLYLHIRAILRGAPRPVETKSWSPPGSDVAEMPVSPKAVRHEWNGERLTLREWAAKYGLTVQTIRGRMHAGATIGEAIARGPEARRRRILVLNGEALPLSDWARRIGLSPHALQRRLKSGWTLERALTTPKQSSS